MIRRLGKFRVIALLTVTAAVAAGAVGLFDAVAGAAPAHAPSAPSAASASNAAAPDTAAPDTAARAALARTLQRRLGNRTAGTYLDRTGRQVVTVTDGAAAREVVAAGATPKLVDRSATELASVTAGLNEYAGTVGTAWETDPATNQVVLTVTPEASGAKLAGLLAAASEYGPAVRVERVSTGFRPLISGGSAILTSTARCSLGFNVKDASGATFFLTAGHCTNIGATWTTSRGQLIGTRVATSFPGNDFGVVQYTGTVAAAGAVGRQDITSAADPVVGQSACRRGSTTGIHCGSVLAVNTTVNYPEGTVTGLIQTNICAEPGDSGGPLFAGSTALGLTSGGSGDCQRGGITFFQPVSEPLARFGLSVF